MRMYEKNGNPIYIGNWLKKQKEDYSLKKLTNKGENYVYKQRRI